LTTILPRHSLEPRSMNLISLAAALGFCCMMSACAGASEIEPAYRVQGDSIPEPLAGAGDAVRGRQIVTGRDGNCLLCHSIPETGERRMGDVAPPLSGVATRLDAGQLRLRVVDPTRVNAEAAMPSYYRAHGLDNVAEAYRGKTILSAQQVEDVVAYLLTLD
jgi:L-cysteine S-thiosulfotransferase